MGHHHDHHHSTNNIKTAFFLNVGFTLLEIIGGIFVNSVAIISDAIHDLGDSLSLGTAWYLDKKSKKDADNKYSYGYSRFSLLGALINSIVLIVGSIFVIKEAIERLSSPEPTDAKGMMFLAIVGVLINGYAALKLSKGKSLNEKVVSWHLLEDVLGWAAVLVASIVMIFVNVPILDPLLSLLITVYILFGVFSRLRETLQIFLQATPKDVHIDEIEEKILKLKNVDSMHHTHIWSIDGESNVFTTHIKLKDSASFKDAINVKLAAKEILAKHNFSHSTIETELEEDCSQHNDNHYHHHHPDIY